MRKRAPAALWAVFSCLILGSSPGAAADAPGAPAAVCGPRAEMLRALFFTHGERLAARAWLKDTMAEWTVNAETGTWSMLLTGPSGGPRGGTPPVSCLVMGGDDWFSIEPGA